MTGLQVKHLYAICVENMKRGNGDKIVLLSDDDEGNGYHTLYYGIYDDPEGLERLHDSGYFHDNNDPRDVVLLG